MDGWNKNPAAKCCPRIVMKVTRKNAVERAIQKCTGGRGEAGTPADAQFATSPRISYEMHRLICTPLRTYRRYAGMLKWCRHLFLQKYIYIQSGIKTNLECAGSIALTYASGCLCTNILGHSSYFHERSQRRTSRIFY